MKPGQRLLRGPLPWVLAFAAALWIGVSILSSAAAPDELTWTEFSAAVEEGQLQGQNLEETTIGSRSHSMEGERVVNGQPTSFRVIYDPDIVGDQIGDWIEAGRLRTAFNAEAPGALTSILATVLPFILILGIFFLLMNNMQGGGGRVMQFGKSKAKMVSKDAPKVTFADVAGADEAVEELREIKEFLSNPQKFQAMGAKIPKGALLYGPPGTGKTLLARAVAGEAGVPFFSISGSDFVEMFVGVGASRVRDLFEQAKANAPAIIFVDEIDAVGRHRGAGMGGGHDEREQTLNQLLVEMDGFDVRTTVILIAATNRPDILDPALLRPGRFDRQIPVDRPDLIGRESILNVHARGKPLDDDVDLSVLARQTPGFTGADLANLVNEGALLAARYGKKTIAMSELEESIERVIAGPERRTRLMSEREKRTVAYHEGGHAIVGHALPNADPVHKVTIIPRGQALGFTMQLPTEDKYLISRSELIDRLAVMLGGRVAEELKIGDITTGAGDDIKKATATAKQMVTQYGMSDLLGPITLGSGDSQPFMGREMGGAPDYSGQVAAQIDEEVRKLLDEAHDEALEILVENDDVLEALAAKLLEVETVDGALMAEVFAPIDKRPTRAVVAPEQKDAAHVIDRLRRLDPSLRQNSGNGSHGNGGPTKATRKTTRKSTSGSSTEKRSTKRSTSARRRDTED
ncbi:ATP-dependent zinc metalloprotease FtsH [Nitriliruptor alkaliphilus]|uniref:ATP-dependent zinc metalloprotease FtsH n=1 Tax=Nitriliruptor alkaliphilus TaxID=427918 RepID=UPI000A4ADF78|nr:ATP-dependent zinc metalloprotease FtsH [Nitriliruptor alkaliphilus]